jgi:hypothetical protein
MMGAKKMKAAKKEPAIINIRSAQESDNLSESQLCQRGGCWLA